MTPPRAEGGRPAASATLRRLRLAAGISLGLDGYNLAIIGAVLTWASASLRLTHGLATLVAAAVLLGSLVGGGLAGWLTDRLGRRTVFAYDLLIFCVFALTSAVAPTPTVLIASRFAMGLAIGADYAISSAYVAEMSAAQSRGYQLGYVWVFWAVGGVSAYLLAALAAATLPEALAWRVLLALPMAPALGALLLRRRVPESPRWLVAAGQDAQGAAVLEAYGLEAFRPDPGQLRPGEGVRRWLLATVPWFLYDFAAYGVGLLLPFVLQESGMTGTGPALVGSAVVAGLGLLGTLAGMAFIDRVGRRPLQGWGLLLPGLLLATWTVLPDQRSLVFFLVVVSLANALSMMGGLVTGVYPAEIFPTRQRATAMGVSTAVSRLGAVIGVIAIGLLETRFGLVGVVAGAAAALMMAGVSTFLLGIETRSRTLEEIVEGALP